MDCSTQESSGTREESDLCVQNEIMKAHVDGYRHLFLNYKGLRNMPPALLTHCKHIQKLYLKRNMLEQLPVNIYLLSNLVELYLHSNCLRSLPDEIGHMKSLTYLDVSNNNLTSLPATIGHLTQLRRLQASSNNLNSLPNTAIGSLKQLQTLQVADNHLQKLPDDIGNCSSLRCLMVDSNHLTFLPHSLHRCLMLEEVYLNGNRLVYLPFSLVLLTHHNLKTIYIDSNPLLQAIPLELLPCVRGYRKGVLRGDMPQLGTKLIQVITVHGDVINLPPQIRAVAMAHQGAVAMAHQGAVAMAHQGTVAMAHQGAVAMPFSLLESSLRYVKRRCRSMLPDGGGVLPKQLSGLLAQPVSWCCSCDDDDAGGNSDEGVRTTMTPIFLETYLALGHIQTGDNDDPVLAIKLCCSVSCHQRLTSSTNFQPVEWKLVS